ncbi:hypothetical protein BCR34DRAFT_667342 [Clohesyomyces aquaticus]|uniref:Cupredoxin n=1 Tax=Clohesyomyces aquaticus TaxID=1231657 RepID=A0A1Y1Z023_9PLEO|nr:hypothetical protein BCR34DRAFT_667342 [Clohesyomyces aquaticus]
MGERSKEARGPVKRYAIRVGEGDHKFKPDTIFAEVGSIVEFDFYPQNHSVVRAEYQYPCIPYEMTGEGKVGFFSGFYPVEQVLTHPPAWTITINDTDPIFFYCSASGSCIDYGMVGVINPNSSTSLLIQRQIAMDSVYSLNPGEPFPSESTPTSFPPLPSWSSIHAPTPKPSLSPGAIAGIIIPTVAVLIIAAICCICVSRNRGLERERRRRSMTVRHLSLTDQEVRAGTGMQMYHSGNGMSLGTAPLSRLQALPPAYFAVEHGDQGDGSGRGSRSQGVHPAYRDAQGGQRRPSVRAAEVAGDAGVVGQDGREEGARKAKNLPAQRQWPLVENGNTRDVGSGPVEIDGTEMRLPKV